jgi:hypothetical protein
MLKYIYLQVVTYLWETLDIGEVYWLAVSLSCILRVWSSNSKFILQIQIVFDDLTCHTAQLLSKHQ